MSLTEQANWETTAEAQLLTRYAPILRFDSRELFFPTSVDGFISSASLMREDVVLHPEGMVTEETLALNASSGAYLRFISEEDRLAVVKEEVKRLARKLLGPRLGRVGLFGRLLDALFQLSILLRPTTPRLTTVASALKAERLSLHDEPPVNNGRVVEEGGWLILHYAYFYVMNDWRSGYHGLNDHEGDWEQAWVFCDRQTEQPVWVVASSHDYIGGDLRRHWDDPICHRMENRPVLYVGAGSHALYHHPGDYVTRIVVPGFRWLFRFQRWMRKVLRIRDEAAERGLGPALGMPFVDAATGDGRKVGQWDLRPLDETRPCFGHFQGLWGLDTGDPTGGERGPSGPKYGRSGDVRFSWADPLGFADLHGTPPPSTATVTSRLAEIDQSLLELDLESSRLLQQAQLYGNNLRESQRITRLLRQKVALRDVRSRVERGVEPAVDHRDHLKHPAVPLPAPIETGRLLAVWAASSVPLLLLVVALLLALGSMSFAPFGEEDSRPLPMSLQRVQLGWLAVGVVAGVSVLEQLVRRHFTAAFRLSGLYGVLVGFVGFVSVISFSRYALGAALAFAGVMLFVANLGELTAVQRRADAAPQSNQDNTEPDLTR